MQQLRRTRTGWLAIILLGAMAIFVLRLFQLQIVQHGMYSELARSSQLKQMVIPADRGEIYMMDGSAIAPVVLNQTVYTVVADPQVIESGKRSEIIASLREIAGGELIGDAEKRLANTNSRYEVLARNVSRTQKEKIEEKKFVGVLCQRGSVRSYPEGQLAAQVLGFVNTEGKGQYGVEEGLDDRLKGRDGLLRSVTDAQNIPLALGKDNVHIEPKSGENIALTIDRNVQSQAEDVLRTGILKARATQGSILVMNPNNGQVLAMANYPTYAPADYAKQTNASVFMNNATMVPYEPASVIKTFLISTGVDKGVVNANSTYMNTDCIQVVDRKMCNATKGLGGTTTVQQVLNNSLNVGTITVARRLSNGSNIDLAARKTIYEYYHDRFGLGSATGIEVNEVPGYIYKPDSVEGNEVRYSAMTYGQSLNLTSVQVVAGFSSIINGGKYYRPTLVAGTVGTNGELTPVTNSPLRQAVSENTSSQMVHMLHTARSSTWMAKGDKPGYLIGGKTGTAEAVVNGVYTMNETTATYIGYGGGNKPEYVIMVYVAAPGKGISLEGHLHASPIFTEMSNWMIDYMKIAPKG